MNDTKTYARKNAKKNAKKKAMSGKDMDDEKDRHRKTAETLRERIRMSMVLDDAMASQLGSVAQSLDAHGDDAGARALVEATRKHRVAVIKHRAMLSAKGLDV